MKDYQFSIVVPALREEFISHTVADIVKNKRGKTEVIVVLDGEWAEPGIQAHPDVRVIHVSKNMGQRGATNFGVKLSRAKYVAKTDAHVAFDEGFDVKLMEDMQDDYTMVPTMRNLHVFNWRCKDCGDESYQGPEPEGCKKCDVNTPDRFEKNIVWRAKPSPQSTAYLFNPELQFKYFNELKRRQQTENHHVVETMSLQGSFFMLTREKYWELNICDESWGGWGQQGTEVALKTWLSGGRVVCNTRTWYAHMFRTQSNFAFPWGNPGRQQQQSRKISRDLFLNNKWDKQVRPLSWVLERFWPELQQVGDDASNGPRWTMEDLEKVKATEGRFKSTNPSKGMIFYTTNKLQLKLAKKVQQNLMNISNKLAIPITSASLKPMDFGKNIHIKAEPGWQTYFKQIIAALEASTADIVYFCEHDVIYVPEHFDFTPPTKEHFYYNQNWWRLYPDGSTNRWNANQVSGLACYRELALEFYRKRLKEIEEKGFNRSYEPGGRDRDKYKVWMSERPNIDLRWGGTLTKDKKSLEDFRDKSTSQGWQEGTVESLPGWKPEQFSDILEIQN